MDALNKKTLSERDICTKFITPAVKDASWDVMSQIREEVFFTKGRIIVRGKLVTRGKAKFADYILYYKPNIPIALIEAKDNNHAVGDGMHQGMEYASTLDIPFVFSSNGDAFLFHDRTGQSGQTETELPLNTFPTPEQLWAKYRTWKGLAPAEEKIVLQNYHDDGGKEPRYYQRIAINKTIEAIATIAESSLAVGNRHTLCCLVCTGSPHFSSAGSSALIRVRSAVSISTTILTSSRSGSTDEPRVIAANSSTVFSSTQWRLIRCHTPRWSRACGGSRRNATTRGSRYLSKGHTP